MKKHTALSFTLCLAMLILSSSATDAKNNVFLGDKLFAEGKYEEALAEVEKFLETHPHNINGMSLKAWSLINLGRDSEAKPVLDAILEKAPNNLDALTAIGIHYRKTGQPEKAMEAYKKALVVNPTDAATLGSVVALAVTTGKTEQAIEYGERAIKQAPNDSVIHANLAIAYHKAENFQKRDFHTKKAGQLGYKNMDVLQQIYSGELIIGPQ